MFILEPRLTFFSLNVVVSVPFFQVRNQARNSGLVRPSISDLLRPKALLHKICVHRAKDCMCVWVCVCMLGKILKITIANVC